jgi:ribosomal protein S18 acetylase RimI-like enzyme
MSMPADPTFESDVRRRIYEYIERTGAVSPSDIRHHVRVETGPSASKPARSSGVSEGRSPMPVTQVREHVRALEASGYLIEADGKYRVSLGESVAAHALEGGTVTIRPARDEDRAALAALIRQVAAEDSYIVARTIAEAIDHEETLLRNNERRSRVFFVASYRPNDRDATDSDPAPDADDRAVEANGEETIVGWVHLEARRLAEVRHVAELTVGVLDEHRRADLGRRLMTHGLDWAADAGYEKVYQTLPATNEEAISFLESQDWTREGTHKRHYRIDGEEVDEVMLATWLDQDE